MISSQRSPIRQGSVAAGGRAARPEEASAPWRGEARSEGEDRCNIILKENVLMFAVISTDVAAVMLFIYFSETSQLFMPNAEETVEVTQKKAASLQKRQTS